MNEMREGRALDNFLLLFMFSLCDSTTGRMTSTMFLLALLKERGARSHQTFLLPASFTDVIEKHMTFKDKED